MRNFCGPLDVEDFYETFACLVLHEESHYVLKHFRFPPQAYDWHLLNVAQDMVIDVRIHEKNNGWRNWQELVDQINSVIDAQGENALFPKISTDPADKNYLLHLSDLDVYTYLEELNIRTPKHPPSFDKHSWLKNKQGQNSSREQGEKAGKNGQNQAQSGKNENPSRQSGENQTPSQDQRQDGEQNNRPKDDQNQGQENQPENPTPSAYEHILSQLASRSRERLSKNAKRHTPKGAQIMDETLHIVAQGKEHNLFKLLEKIIKKISYKQKTNTWKKISRKQPGVKPGVRFKKTPGEVLLMIDTSGSMHGFIREHIADMANGIYTAFSRVARVYNMPSKMFKADVAEDVLNLKPIKRVEELKEIDLTCGGGNDFETVFNKLVLHWKENTQSTQKFPDFILVLTDFGDNWEFLEANAYKAVADRIIWLSTDPYYNGKPTVGHVIDVLSPDWSTSIR